jgi:hypothetical protein
MTFDPLRYSTQRQCVRLDPQWQIAVSNVTFHFHEYSQHYRAHPWNPRSCVFAERAMIPFDPNNQNNLQHIGTAIKRFATPVQGECTCNSSDGTYSECERI